MRDKRFMLLLALALGVRVGLCAQRGDLGRSPDVDHWEYVLVATRLIDHGTLTSPLVPDGAVAAPSALMPPAYAALVAFAYRALGVESYAATLFLQLLNAIATTLAVAVTFSLTRRLADSRTAWIVAVIVALNPAIAGYAHYVWDTNLFILGVVVTVWLAERLSEARKIGTNWFAFGLWLGLLALLNPALTIVYPLLVLWPLARSQRWRLGMIVPAAGLAVLGWLIAIAPWTIRNYVHFDRLMYVRGGFMQELWLGVCPEADENPNEVYTRQFPLKNTPVRLYVGDIGEQDFVDECGRKAIKAIRADPWRYARLSLVRLVDFWAGTVFTHAPPGAGGWPRGDNRALLTVVLSAEVLVILLGCVLPGRKRINTDAYWLLAMVASFSLVYVLTHVQVRFRAPIEPLLAIVTALATRRMFGRRASTQTN